MAYSQLDIERYIYNVKYPFIANKGSYNLIYFFIAISIPQLKNKEDKEC